MRRSSVVLMPKTQRRASKKEEEGKGSEGSKGKRKSRQRYKARIGTCFHGGRTIIQSIRTIVWITAIIQSIRTIVWTTATICRYRSTICKYRYYFNCRECPSQISKRLDF